MHQTEAIDTENCVTNLRFGEVEKTGLPKSLSFSGLKMELKLPGIFAAT
jgi:hypothetical protein